MAGTILVKDVLYRVSAQLTDAPSDADQFKRWTERELVAWLNDGQAVISKYLPSATARVDVIKLATGTRQSIDSIAADHILNGDGSTAVAVKGKALLGVVRNMGADGLTPGRVVNVVSRDVLDGASPDWHASADSAVAEYTYDPRTPKIFYVNPGVASTATVWVEVSHLLNPIQVPYTAGAYAMNGSSALAISIDDQFVDDLVNYILARGHMKEAEAAGNMQIAQAHINLFAGGINAQALALTGVNPNLRMLPMAPTPLAQAS